MKILKITNQNRGQGIMVALDELWESWKLLENGTYSEDKDNIILTNTNGEIFKASKDGELMAARMYNRFIETDLKAFNVFEGPNPSGGYFIFYKFKDPNRDNECIIASIGGIAGGSSIVFKVL